MKDHFCYTTRDNAEVTLCNDVVIVPLSTQTHSLCITKYFDFRSWWMGVSWYLTYQLNSDQVLKKLVILAFFSVNSWMTVDKPRTVEVD